MMRQGRPHRAARVSVPNQEQAIISAEGTTTVGVLCKLSLTGGSVRLPKSFCRGTLGVIAVKTSTGRISAAIEFLGMGRDGAARAQAFRFIHMDTGDRQQLEIALRQMLNQGLGDQRRIFRPLVELARRAFSVAKKSVR